MQIIASDYKSVLIDLKEKIRQSQFKAIASVNHELVLLYWDIGHVILQQQSKKGWGLKVIDSLSSDLKKAFPDVKGFSVRNLKYMRQFADNYKDRVFVQEVLAQLNWYMSNIAIKVENLGKKYVINHENGNGDDRGSLIAIEQGYNAPFEIKRVYYIFDTKEGVGRGFHAHRDLRS